MTPQKATLDSLGTLSWFVSYWRLSSQFQFSLSAVTLENLSQWQGLISSYYAWLYLPTLAEIPEWNCSELKARKDVIPFFKSSFKPVWMDSTSPCNSLIGYSLKWLCCLLVWSKSLLTKTGFDPLGTDQSSYFWLLALDFSCFTILYRLSVHIRKELFSFRTYSIYCTYCAENYGVLLHIIVRKLNIELHFNWKDKQRLLGGVVLLSAVG
jgi:hypothetical protein